MSKIDIISGFLGAGKTTLINLLMRFYDPQGGKITIDDVNIEGMNREDLRKMYGMVLQDSWLFKGTIKENIAYGKTKASEKAGTQQVSKGTGNAVYHTVKKGDNVWTLVNKNYKELGSTVKWVIDNNPTAFTRKGDAKTLKIGAKLLMGYKEKDKNNITQYGVEATWLYGSKEEKK